MADSVGSISVIRLEGSLVPPGQTVAEFTDPGVNGVGFKKMGIRGPRSKIGGRVAATDASAVVSLRSSLAAMKGTAQTIVKDGASYTNYMIHEAEVVDDAPTKSACGPDGAGTTRLCVVAFEVQSMGAS